MLSREYRQAHRQVSDRMISLLKQFHSEVCGPVLAGTETTTR